MLAPTSLPAFNPATTANRVPATPAAAQDPLTTFRPLGNSGTGGGGGTAPAAPGTTQPPSRTLPRGSLLDLSV
jgi:hypothetical protein